jgi:uncharacterized protein YndB with AHSA1/START domain
LEKKEPAMNAAAAKSEPTAPKEFIISRLFDAPRELVFACFTEPERMKDWWGPKGSTVIAQKQDLRPGGFYHYGMRGPDGTAMWGKFVYREIVRPSRLVLINSFSDEAGGLVRHPFSPTWPREMLSTFLFDAQGSGTRLTIKWLPYNATDEERATFDATFDGMTQGWTGTLDQLAGYLATAK